MIIKKYISLSCACMINKFIDVRMYIDKCIFLMNIVVTCDMLKRKYVKWIYTSVFIKLVAQISQ